MTGGIQWLRSSKRKEKMALVTACSHINNVELTKEKFVEDKITNKGRMYKTGDVVRMLEGGYIDFIGRRDNQVKIRGYSQNEKRKDFILIICLVILT